MSHSLFLRHRALPGRRDDLVKVWRRHMPAAIDANVGHEAYAYTADAHDPDVLHVFQQYRDAAAASQFLQHPAYITYLAESEPLLAGPPEVVTCVPLWSKAVGTTSTA